MSNNRRWEDKLRLWQLLHSEIRSPRDHCSYCKFETLGVECRYLKKLRRKENGKIFIYKTNIKPGGGSKSDYMLRTECVEFSRSPK